MIFNIAMLVFCVIMLVYGLIHHPISEAGMSIMLMLGGIYLSLWMIRQKFK